VEVLDMNGIMIYNSAIGPMANGLHNIAIPCSQLASGTYFLRLRSNGTVKTAKFLKN
jgi:hypothetical protein